MNSRNKGKTGEREAASKFREYGYEARRGQQYAGANGDADVVGVPYIHLEIKRRENLNIYDAIDQAKRDSKENDRIPVVMWRKNNCDWLMIMPFEEWMKFYQAYEMSEKETKKLKESAEG